MSFQDEVNRARPNAETPHDNTANPLYIRDISIELSRGVRERILEIAKSTPRNNHLLVIDDFLHLGLVGEFNKDIVTSSWETKDSIFHGTVYTTQYQLTSVGEAVLKVVSEYLRKDGIQVVGFGLGYGRTANRDCEDRMGYVCGKYLTINYDSSKKSFLLPVTEVKKGSNCTVNRVSISCLSTTPFLRLLFKYEG